MPIYRSDFQLRGGLVLPRELGRVSLRCADTACKIDLVNANADESGHIPFLSAIVIGPAEDLDTAKDVLQDVLMGELDVLSFVCRTAFAIDKCTMVLEWEPYQKSRRGFVVNEFDPMFPPAPNLDAVLTESAGKITTDKRLNEIIRRSARLFRYGLLADVPEEQFHYFWRAFEILAENEKSRNAIPINCPTCQSDTLTCAECGQAPKRIPMGQDAMKSLLSKLRPDGEVVYTKLARVRHTLTHGGSQETIEKRSGLRLDQAVDLVGAVAWYSIHHVLPRDLMGISYLQRETILSRKMIALAEMTSTYDETQDYPSEERLSKAKLQLLTRFSEKEERS